MLTRLFFSSSLPMAMPFTTPNRMYRRPVLGVFDDIFAEALAVSA